MKRYAVSSRGRETVLVRAANWVAALGLGLEEYDVTDGLERLACEVLPNGTVIARDIATGTGFIVRESEEEVEEGELTGDDQGDAPSPPVRDPAASDGTRLSARLVRISEQPTRGKACQVALVLARRVVAAESGAVILDDGDHLRFFAAAGPQAHRLIGARLPAGSGVAAFCIEHRRPIILEDATKDPRHCGDIDRLTGYATHALACVPIVYEDRVFGVVEMINLPDNTTFSRRCVHELNAIAQSLAERLERHRVDRLSDVEGAGLIAR